MPGELPLINTRVIDIGGGVLMSVPANASGLSADRRSLSAERKRAIQQVVLSLSESIISPEGERLHLQPISYEGIMPYESKKPILRRLGIPLFTNEHETFSNLEDPNDGYVNEYRGMTLAEAILYATVADGSIVVTSDFKEGITRITSSPARAASFALEKSKDRHIAERILHGFQLQGLFELTVDDIMGSILMSPIVMRFTNTQVSQHERRFYKAAVGSPLPFSAVAPPMQVQESTPRFNAHTMSWSHINLHAFAAQFARR